jgi:type IV secretion system protein VirB10
MSRDPDSFEAPRKMRRLPIYLGLGGVALLMAILVWSVNFSTQKKQADAPKVQAVAKDSKPLIEGNVGPGLAVAPPVAPAPAAPTQQPIVVVTSPESPELTRERDELRRRRHQAALSALSSPLIIRKGGKTAEEASKPTAAPAQAASRSPERERGKDNTSLAEQLAGQLPGREGAYDPAADRDKENFFGRAAAKGDRQWQASGTRIAGQRFEVKTGSVIPATMIGGINSDLPGQIIAQVSRNVYDTADGRYLLIPQGAKLYGVYDSRIIYGQSRVLVAWNRIVFPDGSAITLDAMPGTDSAGFGGFEDEVNNHYFRIFGTALLMSLITGGTAWAVDTVTPTTSTGGLTGNASPSLQQQMTSALATQFGQTTAQVLSKGMNVKPTLEIRPGYRFNVVVTKDLVFGGPYHEQR